LFSRKIFAQRILSRLFLNPSRISLDSAFTDIIVNIVLPDMPFFGLFIASSPKFYFENPDWYMEWLGEVSIQLIRWT
jgi:hypothetical protein